MLVKSGLPSMQDYLVDILGGVQRRATKAITFLTGKVE